MSDYKRLTDKEHRYKYCANCKYRNCQYCDEEMYLDAKAYERLAELEDMIEQNVLIKLPCKVGDRVWLILYEDIYEYEVYGFYIANLNHSGRVNLRTCDFKKNEKMDDERLQCIGIYFDDFSEAVFLTKAEAEAELAKIRGQKQ